MVFFLVHLYLSLKIDLPQLAGWGYILIMGFKTTADGHCSHESKRHVLLGRKTMTNLNSILKSRDITLLTKVRIVKGMVFAVFMYRCELGHKEG